MPFEISRSYLDNAGRTPGLARGHKHGNKMAMKKGPAAKRKIMSMATVGGTAFGLGALEGKGWLPSLYSTWLTADLVAAAGIHALDFFNVFGKYGDVANDVGNGALAYWAGVQGQVMFSKGAAGGATKGEYPTLNQASRPAMSPEQLWSMQFR